MQAKLHADPANPPHRQAAEENPRRKALAKFVDAAVIVLLAALGMLAGELVLRKSTGDILRSSASAPKFPPTDLLIWLLCAAFFVLIYAWLGKRGWSAGSWLRRRGAA